MRSHRYLPAFVLALALGAAALLLLASTGTRAELASGSTLALAAHATDVTAQKKRRAVRRAPASAPSNKIACTWRGCHPIPPGCTPVTQYDWRGNPTGYDAVVCR